MFNNTGPTTETSPLVVFGDVRLTGGSNTATTAPISQLVGKVIGTNCEIVGTIRTAAAVEYVVVTSLSPDTGAITFTASTSSGENRDVLYHVWAV